MNKVYIPRYVQANRPYRLLSADFSERGYYRIVVKMVQHPLFSQTFTLVGTVQDNYFDYAKSNS